MYEVEQVCDRVLFISRGRILLEGAPENIVPSEVGLAMARTAHEQSAVTRARAQATMARKRPAFVDVEA